MDTAISADEKKILAALEEGLPRSVTYFEDMSWGGGAPALQLSQILRDWRTQGKLRRIGAIVNHSWAGLGAGAMVVWQGERKRAEEVGEILARFREVSHAYERGSCEMWSYDTNTRVRTASSFELNRAIERMSKACWVAKYCVLVEEKGHKKTTLRYVRLQLVK